MIDSTEVQEHFESIIKFAHNTCTKWLILKEVLRTLCKLSLKKSNNGLLDIFEILEKQFYNVNACKLPPYS